MSFRKEPVHFGISGDLYSLLWTV